MTKLGLLPWLPRRWRRRTHIDQREMLARRKVYTIETLRRIEAEHPDWKLHFAVGSDAAASWPRWRSPRQLALLCDWWTARRPGEHGRLPKHFRLIHAAMPEVSSTDLRADLTAGLDVSRWIHPKALDLIIKNGLYGTELMRILKKGLKPSRLAHTIAVRTLAEGLARHWKEDVRRASWAALLHDCGRLIPRSRYAAFARNHKLGAPLQSEILRRRPSLLHAYVGADLARRRFGCSDLAVLNAIKNHTLGAARMSRLDLLIYVADAVSEDRSHPDAAKLRRLAFHDLEAAFCACLRAKLRHALSNEAWLHPTSFGLWNSRCAK